MKLKFVIISALVLLLLVPLAMIRGVISERQQSAREVVADIARSSTGEQVMVGPLLAIPYRVVTRRQETVRENGNERVTVREETSQGVQYLLPDTLQVNGNLRNEERRRGIYRAVIYHSDLKLQGEFKMPARVGPVAADSKVTVGEPFLVLGVSDIRGIKAQPVLNINDQPREFEPGTGTPLVANGIHANLGEFQAGASLRFGLQMRMQGMTSLAFAPLGRTTRVMLDSNYPHPSFQGAYLPEKRDVGPNGFSATWETSHFATNGPATLERCAPNAACAELTQRTLGVTLVTPVDVYLQSDRAAKYGLLFIALTFVAFFLFEVLKRLDIHPIQYTLVGVALVMFFLLLFSASEHLAFSWSYLIAAGACISLLVYYVSHVLQSLARALGFGVMLSTIYGVLYTVLASEDFALLMGTGVLFGSLTTVMVLTRKVDWYQMTRRKAAPSAA